nr:hypothetical protein [Massilia aurea]
MAIVNPDPAPAGARPWRHGPLLERLEDARQVFGGDARAAIDHFSAEHFAIDEPS